MADNENVLDVRGLSCPMPIVKTKKALDSLAAHSQLEVWATDPGSVADFEAWTRRTGHKLVWSKQVGEEYRFRIEKRESQGS
ncbi:MAG: sulfurtransferase TusA family protein [Firmicutes bacterium]|jgi:tRNA 2-thiouridine synthesizing protein A|uniref:SirA family protein n=1 Tax=Sulfobacillus benefaciens TaxID=453960 RepID=A0A2T2X4M3_9FIRM|nr:sulfurtransferase TusA family protein [Bacillota bacterium]MCL5013730.1 sulfurtransferase TusA family protein [Bacillota bacterium]PSR29406.1 MAG: SirA family protein [Sulfobacillus benefaciens]HBQ96028.1 SirA family protein [Sulfobacillus sp.]